MSGLGSVPSGGIPSTVGLPTVREFSNTSVIDLGVPFSQTNWPNPTRPVNGIVDFQDQSIIGFVIPFHQTDWTNPQQPRQSSQSFSSSIAHLFQAPQSPVFTSTTSVPPGYTATEPGFVDQAIWNLIIPFKQTDWSTPQQPRQSSLSFSASTAHLFPVVAVPFSQQNWPNPRGVTNTQGWLDTFPNRTVSTQVPFSNTAWPNPLGRTATEVGFVDQSIWALVIPFAQTDWPNPVRRPVAPIEFHDSFNRPVAATNPFAQTNWPNPSTTPVTLRSLGFLDGVIIGIDPFSQQDWPNPGRGPQWSVAHHGFTDTYNRTVVAAPVPFVSVSTANPVFTRAIHTGVVDQAIWAFVIPFSQTDWPNPVPRQPYVIGWIDNFPNRGPPGTPFAQLDWPNPQRAVVLPFWWTDSYNRTPVAIGNPFSQKDWPNPNGPTAIHAVGVIPYATVLIPLPPPPPPSTEPDWKPFLVSMGKLMGMG